jgi:exopolysaccharide biosynthesis polyprenyl glycosylphosphotransferase
MLREKDQVIRRAMAIFDVLVVSLVFFISFFLRRHFHIFYKLDFIPNTKVIADAGSLSISDYLIVLFLVVPIWAFSLHLSGIYKSLRTKTLAEVIFIIIKATFLATIIFGTSVFLFKLKFVSRAFFAIFLCLSSSIILTEKIAIFSVMHYVRRRGYNYRQLLIVGTGKRAIQFINKIKGHPEWGLRVAGVIEYEPEHMGKDLDGTKVIGMLEDIPRILHNHTIDEVVFVIPRSKLGAIENSLYVCETEGVQTTIAVDLFDLKIAKAHQTELDGVPLITFDTTVAMEWELFIKRAIDIIISGLGIILLLPVFVVTAILIKITSTGPIFYLQKRVGLNGRRFILYKFRSMHKNAHEKLSELMEKNEMKGPVFKIRNDPRVTPLGWFLRKFSIDELPQLFNVFIGQMSLVGPRPPIPKEVAQYEPWQRRRLSMRPGITCLWQISGRNKIGFDEWMKLDLQYIDNWSLGLDLKILLKTIPVVLFGVGAY